MKGTSLKGGHMKGDKRTPDCESVSLDGRYPVVVPVMSAAGGVGRSTVAALLAVALHQRTTDSKDRAVALCDCRPRCASPWPGWLDHTAEHGTSWLAGCPADQFGREIRRSTSAIDVPGGRPLWVLTDSGPLVPDFAGADPGPATWTPLLRYLRVAVIDGDPLEGFRLARQQADGEPSTAAAWMALPSVSTAAVWVTDPSPAGMARTLEAMTAAEACGLPMRQVVVAVNDCRGHGWPARSRSRRTLLADRVGAIVELGHDAALLRDDRPGRQAEHLGRRDVAALTSAVLAAADSPAASPAAAPSLVPAERTPWHVASTAHAVPASS
jgi:hypothetical protein